MSVFSLRKFRLNKFFDEKKFHKSVKKIGFKQNKLFFVNASAHHICPEKK